MILCCELTFQKYFLKVPQNHHYILRAQFQQRVIMSQRAAERGSRQKVAYSERPFSDCPVKFGSSLLFAALITISDYVHTCPFALGLKVVIPPLLPPSSIAITCEL